MRSQLSEQVGAFLLRAMERQVPQRNAIRSRAEKFGYTVFDIESLGFIFTGKVGFAILNRINGQDNFKTILRRVSAEEKVPYFVAAEIVRRSLAQWQATQLVRLEDQGISGQDRILSHAVPVPHWTPHRTRVARAPRLSGPNQVSWLITNRCNLSCSHCGNTSQVKLDSELTYEECFNLVDQCADIGVFVLNISGGEPLLKDNWFEILAHARERALEVGITTNGTLVSEETAQKLARLRPFNVHVSLDGIGEVHDTFRNRQGVFDLVVGTIEMFRQYKIPFGVTTSITKSNFPDLDNVKDFIKQNRVNSWNLYYALPIGCLNQADAISPEEYYEFARKIAGYKRELRDTTRLFVGDSLGYYGHLNVRDWFWDGCKAGLTGCAIDAAGNVKGCPILPSTFHEGNVRDRPLRDIWRDSHTFSYNRKPRKSAKHCKVCKYWGTCRGGCLSSMCAQGTDFKYNDYCIYHLEQCSS